jgi:hypothetical protein
MAEIKRVCSCGGCRTDVSKDEYKCPKCRKGKCNHTASTANLGINDGIEAHG